MSKLLVRGSRSSNDIFFALHKAGIFADDPTMVRRVVIDLTVGEPARIYVERFADDSLVDVVLAGGLTVVERDDDVPESQSKKV